jgi:2,3,4,5-tetrahydropyridine-2-carboxylate N-succinyltransferase
MNREELQRIIESAWDRRDSLDKCDAALRSAVEKTICLLDKGEARVAEPVDGGWKVNEWLNLTAGE